MIVLASLVLAACIFLPLKNKGAAPVAYVLAISFGSILNEYYPFSTYIITIYIVLVLLAKSSLRLEMPKNYFITISWVIIITVLLSVFGIHNSRLLINDIYSLILLPTICYYSMSSGKVELKSFPDYYIIYIIFNLIILMFRATINYSFFGFAITMDYYSQFYDLYSRGGSLYRPSSLLSPIVFAVEVIFGVYFLICKYGIRKHTVLISVIATVGLVLMRSRTSIVLALFLIACILIQKKLYVKGIILFILGILFIAISGEESEFLQLITFTESSYFIRISSVRNTLDQIRNLDTVQILLGQGFGTANRVVDGQISSYYSENFYVALLVDLGIIGLLVFLVVAFASIYKAIKNGVSGVAYAILGLLIINLFASSLSNYVIQILFWLMIMYANTINGLAKTKSDFRWINKYETRSNN